MSAGWCFLKCFFVVLLALYLHPSIIYCCSCSIPHVFYVVCVMLLCIPHYLLLFSCITFRCSWFQGYTCNHYAYMYIDTMVSFCRSQLPGAILDPEADYEDDSYESTLVKELGGVAVNKTEDLDFHCGRYREDGEDDGEFITWLSPFSGQNRLQDIQMTYGNEVSADYTYCSPCLIVRVAAASNRVRS